MNASMNSYDVGEVVDVTISRAMVAAVEGGALVLALASDDVPTVRVPLGAPVNIGRVQPANGPIIAGDIWEDRYGGRWFAVCAPIGDPRMIAQGDGGTQTPEWLTRHHSPLTLAYRDEPAQTEPEDADGGGRYEYC